MHVLEKRWKCFLFGYSNCPQRRFCNSPSTLVLLHSLDRPFLPGSNEANFLQVLHPLLRHLNFYETFQESCPVFCKSHQWTLGGPAVGLVGGRPPISC